MLNMENYEKLTPDTSVIIEGIVSKKIESKQIKIEQLLIHEAVLAELEHQANQGKEIGYLGLDELKKLRKLSKTHGFEIKYSGTRPRPIEIKHASLGEIDSLIRDLAYNEDATLMTADRVQSEVALAKGIKIVFIEQTIVKKTLKFEKYFTPTTMSVHLREQIPPYAKRGLPGTWEFVKLDNSHLSQEEVQYIAKEIVEEAKSRKDAFIEIERRGSSIVQLADFRIVITRPPLSDGWEITLVRPIKKMILAEYNLDEKTEKRIERGAEGILIAGAPGQGKSTFAAALAEFYAQKGKIVKTIEAPRDLQLSDSITQYAISYASGQEIHDILLLTRPDYTIFDEMRNVEDFKLFADLRLAGIGLVGVVHATNPVDAIQRFIGKMETGVIPSVIDTIIFIKNGTIGKMLTVKMSVKVPSGMTEADLARPVVEINDFLTGNLEFEIYSYGEETVVIPVSEVRNNEGNPVQKIAKRFLQSEIKEYSRQAKVEISSDNRATVYVPESEIARIIGKQGKNIMEMEKNLGISIDVKSLEAVKQESIPFDIFQTKKAVIMKTSPKFSKHNAAIYLEDELLFSAIVNKSGELLINKNSELGRELSNAITTKKKLEIRI
jgi:ATPase